MVKSNSDGVFIVNSIITPDGAKKVFPDDGPPPQVPPRMKKKGPALPEKPPHMRVAKSSPNPSSQAPREPRLLPIERYLGPHREVLVAASKGVRERPVEKRQREPAKLLMPTSGGPPTAKELVILPPKTSPEDRLLKKGSQGALEDRQGLSKRAPPSTSEDRLALSKKGSRKPTRAPQPVLLIPRGMMQWGSPVSYALWMQRESAAPVKGVAPRREAAKQGPATPARSGSVTRSGSLTSQGSSSSDSETFPKSVLKKQRRATPSKGSCRKMKNVTFNAFATVQLMEA